MNRVPFIYVLRICVLMITFSCLFQDTSAQNPIKLYTVKNGNMSIYLSKDLPPHELDEFIRQYDLSHLSLRRFITTGYDDSVKLAGWQVILNTDREIVINKPLLSPADILDPGERIIFSGDQPPFDAMFPVVSNSVVFGYNRFKNKNPFTVTDSVVRFFLKGNQQAIKVMLAGNFNDWNPDALRMARTDSGWIANVKLVPGKYWYKFIIDGRWATDTDNFLNENDGLGNTNSVFYFPNTLFRLNGYEDSRKVFVAGSFNNWKNNELEMKKKNGGWELPMYLANGTHTYRFIVDNKWMADPVNPLKFPDENNNVNSVITKGKPFVFKLPGYKDAGRVFLTGSFNNWRKNELVMNKTGEGWELPYVLAPGNYEYNFIVDGKTVSYKQGADDPKENTTLVLNPNYTFKLKGFENARTVFLAGDFNNWSDNSLPMQKVNGEWQSDVYLSPGKHLYKFIVNGKWILDPANKLWEENEHQTGNSVLWIDK